MKRSTICLDKTFSVLNKALFHKWCWRFSLEREPLWRGHIIGEFREEVGGGCSCGGMEGFGVRL